MSVLTVGKLKNILKDYDEDMPLCITDSGKDHNYGVTFEDIKTMPNPYFGNDIETEREIYHKEYDWDEDEPIIFLNIGTL